MNFHPSLLTPYAVRVFIAMALLWVSVVQAQYTASEEYQLIGYAQPAVENSATRLGNKLKSGELSLQYREQRGYLDDLLAELGIAPSSQLLVFSPTSLQHKLISPEKPRAVYFNDDTYIGFVQNSNIIEVTTIDEKQGIVFYTFDNTEGTDKYFERASQTCLVCHDTQGTMGGGVPMLMALSSLYSTGNVPLENYSGIGNINDTSPIDIRWGGWYVSGEHGSQKHLGNILLEDYDEVAKVEAHRRGNIRDLNAAGLVDTSPYPGAGSDIVALMVLEHQLSVQNQITYIKFKAPAVLKRRGLEDYAAVERWDDLPQRAWDVLPRMLGKLVERLLFFDAAPLQDRFQGNADYARWFQSQGPADAQGRSLRQLELNTRLFAYPVSYLLYSEDFNTLPGYARDYVYARLAAYLEGRERYPGRQPFNDSERQQALEILLATLPGFAAYTGLDLPPEPVSSNPVSY